jgi:hypothetical protein
MEKERDSMGYIVERAREFEREEEKQNAIVVCAKVDVTTVLL